MTIAECLQRARELQSISDSARLDVELLLCKALAKPRSYLYTWPEKSLNQDELASFTALVDRRKQGEPIAYLLGEREFWSLKLKVNDSTLIPRPETELLVETALAFMPDGASRVLDLGTGTGAIALALASERSDSEVVAVDSSPAAVNLAIENARQLGLKNVQITRSDWFENLSGERFDLIVTNPPYIDEADPHLKQGDVRFEPHSALVAGNHGLADIEHIIDVGRQHLNPGGWLIIEHGFEQGESVLRLFAEAGYEQVGIRKDLAGRDRLTLGQKTRQQP
ncbi:peptide chain release factor N(5)-glutamine methyltransferase [Proteobacteria bacterium 005FR1]|nr:peptide chain release factor N(5)-glutamine methyltransferase [Proteobacteria bacterium 005FR1]